MSGINPGVFWTVKNELGGYAKKFGDVLKEYELDDDAFGKLSEQEREWFHPKLVKAAEAAANGEWGPLHAVLGILSKFSKGECRLDLSEDRSWVESYLPVVLPPDWKLVEKGSDGAFYNSRHGKTVLLSGSKEDDGRRWLHFSMSCTGRVPTWDELKYVKDVFLGDRTAVQVFPKKEKYVNIHPYVLHLWCCVDKDEILPDFTQGTGSI